MRVLVTGAAGFIGTVVAAELRHRGYDVVSMDALIPQAHHHRSIAHDTHVVDVRDHDAVTGLLAGVDVVCHQAAMVGAGVDCSDMPLYAAHNDLGTATLLAAMVECGVYRLVLASSMVVYGEGRYVCGRHGPQHPDPRRHSDLAQGRFDNCCSECGDELDWSVVEENAPLDPRSSYAASKVAAEHYARCWARQASGAVVALRYHNVYGAGMPRSSPYSGVAALFRSALESGEGPRVFEDGRQMRDFVHVQDVATANVRAVDALAPAHVEDFRAFNVCSGVPVSIGEVASTLCSSAGSGVMPEVTGEWRAGDVRHVVASPKKAANVLGFTASVHPRQGLADFLHDPMRG